MCAKCHLIWQKCRSVNVFVVSDMVYLLDVLHTLKIMLMAHEWMPYVLMQP